MELTVVENNDQYNHIALDGRLDLEGVQAVQMKFMGHTASTRNHSIIDMSKVDFIASLGIAMLLDSAKALKRNDHKLVLFALQPMVFETLKNGGLDKAMDLADSVDDAKAMISA